MSRLLDIAQRQLGLTTHRLRSVPVVVLMPHSRCNCRCVMCDIWKANRDRKEISRHDLEPHLDGLRRLRVRQVVLSGGEPLMHGHLWTLCELLRDLDIRITLLSTGLLLRRYAEEIVRWCDEVIVSLDGSRDVHDRIRDVPRAFDRLADGVAALREHESEMPVTGRCVLQRLNFRDLPHIIEAARGLGLDRISFLAADTSSQAFNRPQPWDAERSAEVAPSPEEARELAGLVESVLVSHAADFRSGFIAERPEKMRHLARYYLALHGQAELPPVTCNAPWVSTVVEADGTVRPCFFHRSLGNIHERPLEEILNSEDAVRFRRELDVPRDSTCRTCVCTLHLSPWASLPTPRRRTPGSAAEPRQVVGL